MGSSVESRNPLIKRLLTSYRISSESSLSGPTDVKLEKNFDAQDSVSTVRFTDEKLKKESKNDDGFRQCAMFMTMDNAFSGLKSTELEGETIACFEIGGENRLCLAQIIKSILSSFSLPEIHAVFESLHIFSAICSPAQMKCLKEKEIIPQSALKCGLITKSDAQRFCSVLLRSGNLLTAKKKHVPKEPFTRKRLSFVYEQGSVNKSDCFGVAHKCFGGCWGTFIQNLYESSSSSCIQCNECMMLLTPAKFVSHFHTVAENRQTCHWGFDSANWRHYLELDPRELPEYKDTLEKIKQLDNPNFMPRHITKDHVTRRVCTQTVSSLPVYKTSKGSLPFNVLHQEPPPLVQRVTFRPDMEGFAPNVSLLPIDGLKEFGRRGSEERHVFKYEAEEEEDDDDDDGDDDGGAYDVYKRGDVGCDGDIKCQRHSKVLTSASDEDVSTIQQLDEIQEAEMKLFRMALSEEATEAEKAKIFNEFCKVQKKLQTLLEGLVTENKQLSQKYEELSSQRYKKDLLTAANWPQNTEVTRGPKTTEIVQSHPPHKKRHCHTASPDLCRRTTEVAAKVAAECDSDGDGSSGESRLSSQTSERPHKRKRCNTYTAQTSSIKMEMCLE